MCRVTAELYMCLEAVLDINVLFQDILQRFGFESYFF